MKIGLDLRFLDENHYSQFIIELVKGLLYYAPETQYTIYTNKNYTAFQHKNVDQKVVSIKIGSLKEQTQFLKILNQDKNNLVIFFHYSKPIFYKEAYYSLVPSLKDIYYQNFDSYIEKYKYLILLEKNLKNAEKVICFDQNTKDELIERLNLNEKHIELLKPFLNEHKLEVSQEELALDINAKFSIINDYLIYSGGEGIEKNIERLITVFHRLNKEKVDLELVLLGDEVSKNITLRNLIIEYNLQNKVHFLGVITPGEKKLIYAKALGVIFPSLYEPFPFEISEGLFSGKPMLLSNIKSLRNIFDDNAYYFSPISSNSIVESVRDFLKEKKKKVPDLQNIIHHYNINNSAGEFLKIINKV